MSFMIFNNLISFSYTQNFKIDNFQFVGQFLTKPLALACGKEVVVSSIDETRSHVLKKQVSIILRIFLAMVSLAILPLTLIGILCLASSKTYIASLKNYSTRALSDKSKQTKAIALSIPKQEENRKNSSQNYLVEIFPMKKPDQMILGLAQKQRYSDLVTKKSLLRKNWVPVPTSIKERWNEAQIKEHLKSGFPIYIRSMHCEDEFCTYMNIPDAILPSRINKDKSLYNPMDVYESIYASRYDWIPINEFQSGIDESQLRKEIITKVKEIQQQKQIGEIEAFIQHAITLHKKYNDKFSADQMHDLIFSKFLQKHSQDGSNMTPFKGMVGVTFQDEQSIKEIKDIIKSFKDKKVLIILDRYGRFIHNRFNRDQAKEFLAFGGILQSEIVYEMDSSDFDEFISKVNS